MDNFSILAVIGWALILALIAYILYVGAQRAQGRTMRFSVTIILLLLIGGLGLNTLGNGLVFIQPQERAVVISALSNTGYRGPSLNPGLNLIVPFFENVKRYSVAQQAYTMSKAQEEGQIRGDDSVTARTADGQLVYIDATVQYQVDDARVIELYVKWQDRYMDAFVRPQSRGIIYNRAAAYQVEEVYSTKRDELAARITEDLSRIFEQNGLKLTAFVLRNVTFGEEYAQSIEQKQIAQQNAERAKFLVELELQEAERVRVQAKGQADAAISRARGEAESQVIRAKAEAEALRLVSDALKDNPDLLTFRYIEKLSPNVQTIFLPSNQPFLLDGRTLMGNQPVGPIPPTATAVPTPTPAPTRAPAPTATP
jgi:regulator of protease activity HflC (stomatin/prohibitin superfamily)